MKNKCPKCGSHDYTTEYHQASYEYRVCGHWCSPTKEHLHLSCNTCGYDWSVPTLDKKPRKVKK